MGTLAVVSQVLLALAGIFLMIVVLLQRGRGGGLAGAFGGLGGQSAFGTKAGDVFTRITIVIAIIWVVLAGLGGYFLRAASNQRGTESFEGNVTTDDGTDTDADEGEPRTLLADPLGEPSETEPPDADTTEDTGPGLVVPNDEPADDANPPAEPPTEE